MEIPDQGHARDPRGRSRQQGLASLPAALGLLVLLSPLVGGTPAGGCETQHGLTVCWDDTGDTLFSDPSGTLVVRTYTDHREGDGSGTYTATRSGVRVVAGPTDTTVERARYEYVSGDRTIRADETRVRSGEADLAAGLRRSTYGAAASCEAYADGVARQVPCNALFP